MHDIEDPVLAVHVGPECRCDVGLTVTPDNEWIVVQHHRPCPLWTPTPVLLGISLMDLLVLSVNETQKARKPRGRHPSAIRGID